MLLFQVILTAVFTAALSGLLTYLAAWGIIVDPATLPSGWASTLAASFAATVGAFLAAWVARAKKVLESAGIKTIEDLVNRIGTEKVVQQMPKTEVLNAVGKMPEVTSVEVKSQTLADAVPSPKVTQG